MSRYVRGMVVGVAASDVKTAVFHIVFVSVGELIYKKS